MGMKTIARLAARRSSPASCEREIVTIYPHRSAVPREAWREVFTGVRHEIGVLVYAGEFLAQDDEVMQILATQATRGVAVRILLGDPGSTAVARRGADEGIGGELAAMARRALTRYRAVLEPFGAQVRLHSTVLYTSMYWADGEMLVNQHVFGTGAAGAPVTHLRRAGDGRLTSLYREAFERVWASAAPSASW
jgi:hypothetical protein